MNNGGLMDDRLPFPETPLAAWHALECILFRYSILVFKTFKVLRDASCNRNCVFSAPSKNCSRLTDPCPKTGTSKTSASTAPLPRRPKMYRGVGHH